ncbi:MAG: carboxypeptidase-like regulatory domain-containing protein, partial [Burkholderiales bacterium]
MTRGSYLFCLIAAWLLAAPVSIAAAQKQPDPGSIRLRVKDPSGAVIPGALVQVTGVEPRTSHIVRSDVVSDSEGIATIEGLVPGRYAVEVAFPGFETQTIADLRVRTGETRRDIVLPIMRVDESVAVGRDPETSASDPGNDRFSAVLTREQIDALPDDPEEMEKVLQEMAGPGGTIRVDGFRGGRLPPKSQIRSIRFASGMFAAENHGGGLVFVDIMTQPGMGPMRGGLDVTFRDEAMNARNAFQQEKAAEQTQQYAFNLSGTLVPERTSFSLSAGGASLYDSANVFAALADGTRDTSAVRRPSDRINFTGRLDHALTKSHSLRASYQQNGNDQRNLGVGGFDLADRAYDRTLNERLLRLSESGPLTRNWFGESRLQIRWTDSEMASAVEAQTTRVLDAFTIGGAQQA